MGAIQGVLHHVLAELPGRPNDANPQFGHVICSIEVLLSSHGHGSLCATLPPVLGGRLGRWSMSWNGTLTPRIESPRRFRLLGASTRATEAGVARRLTHGRARSLASSGDGNCRVFREPDGLSRAAG